MFKVTNKDTRTGVAPMSSLTNLKYFTTRPSVSVVYSGRVYSSAGCYSFDCKFEKIGVKNMTFTEGNIQPKFYRFSTLDSF